MVLTTQPTLWGLVPLIRYLSFVKYHKNEKKFKGSNPLTIHVLRLCNAIVMDYPLTIDVLPLCSAIVMVYKHKYDLLQE